MSGSAMSPTRRSPSMRSPSILRTEVSGVSAVRRSFHEQQEEDFCSICYDSFEVQKCTKLECGHTYHQSCIRTWVLKSRNSSCPMCRTVSPKLWHILTLEYGYDHSWAPSDTGQPAFDPMRDVAYDAAEYQQEPLPFAGRLTVAGIYVFLLWWHQANPAVSWLVEYDISRILIGIILAVYVLARSFGYVMQHVPSFVEAFVPSLLSFYIFWIVINSVFPDVGYVVMYMSALLVVFSLPMLLYAASFACTGNAAQLAGGRY